MKNYLNVWILSVFVLLVSCESNQNQQQENVTQLAKECIQGVVDHTIIPTYDSMTLQAEQLAMMLTDFKLNPTQAKLDSIRIQWKQIRRIWELSEGFLFGPVSTENIDPRLDTWPINIQDLESLLQKQSVFSQTDLNLYEEGLKGFHPLEYLLWGKDGNKSIIAFDTAQINLMIALSDDIAGLSRSCSNQWNSTFSNEFQLTSREAMLEIVGAMQGICAEVSEGKLGEPFELKNSQLEESPFSKNSLEDFKNNIRSVGNVYHANFSGDGKGVADFVKFFNLSLHNKIETQLKVSMQALEAISIPFGDAIHQQPVAVKNAIDQIAILSELLETELLPLVQDRL